ncbi:MAG: tetratricopeptide repeat protein, partial [Cyanobacteria bacterium P01_E01_bin.6]
MVNSNATHLEWNQVQSLVDAGKYADAAKAYEVAIEHDPDERSSYWYLGLIMLLQGEETEAQTTWFMPLSACDSDETMHQWSQELLLVLDDEAARQQINTKLESVWIIRQHIRDLDPTNFNNLLLLIQTAIKIDRFHLRDLIEWELLDKVKDNTLSAPHPAILSDTLLELIKSYAFDPFTYDLVKACIPFFEPDPKLFVEGLMNECGRIAFYDGRASLAAHLLELGYRLAPHNQEVLKYLSVFYQNSSQFDKAIDLARQAYDQADQLIDQIMASHVLLRGLMKTGGRWSEVEILFTKHLALLGDLIQSNTLDLNLAQANWMFNSAYSMPYLRDDLRANRLLQNQISHLCQVNVRKNLPQLTEHFSKGCASWREAAKPHRPLKIGYMSSCLKQHSVGWLARWLYQHHDRENVRIHSYMVGYRQRGEDRLNAWYTDHSDVVHKLEANGEAIAQTIFDDDLDILVDLDSLTLDTTCQVMALKPAPIQVTWLGWDASGIPAVDYYMVDPYVVPDNADDYYSEILWRLPRTYIAVDGFEQGVPSIRRSDLEIPDDAVVYFSGQNGYKRHPQTVQMQMKIIKEVPNSYFLVKTPGEDETMKQLFYQAAEIEGVDGDRLRFLPRFPSELIHRANLGIADVVLDTYPYNGATTTLEVLWAGIPLVTRVGSHFSSRNSYTMMINAGITEGIAWTDDEYIEWGIRFGVDV